MRTGQHGHRTRQRTRGATPYELKPSEHSSHAAILKLVGQTAGGTAIDVGCATGYLASAMTARGWRVIGIEPDRTSAAMAAEHCAAVHGVAVEAVDFTTLPKANVIVFGDVLEHLVDPLRVLTAAKSALTADGTVVVSLPNVANVIVRLSLLMGRFDYSDRGILDRTHLRFFTKRTAIALARDAGLTVDTVMVTPIPVELVFPLLARRAFRPLLAALHVCTRLAPRLLGYQFVFSATGE